MFTFDYLNYLGLGIWPAAVLLARWVVQRQDLLRGKVVVELGAGCGLPALAAGDDSLMYFEQGWTDSVKSYGDRT
jgi:predicted nicotinamide N-methyase